jgi:hypothetical protein
VQFGPRRLFFPDKYLQSRNSIFDTIIMPRPKQAQNEVVLEIASRILAACKSGHSADLQHALEHARRLTSRTDQYSTLEMERLEALTGAIESLEHGPTKYDGALRLLEHLAQAG